MYVYFIYLILTSALLQKKPSIYSIKGLSAVKDDGGSISAQWYTIKQQHMCTNMVGSLYMCMST